MQKVHQAKFFKKFGNRWSNQTKQAYEAARARLKERYGNPSILNQAFLDKLDGWPQIKTNQPKELQRFSDFLTQICEIRKATPDSLKILDFPSESTKILSKLPMHIEIEWRDIVYSHSEKAGPCAYPSFDRLAYFIERKSKKANIPELQILNRCPSQTKPSGTQPVYKRENKTPRAGLHNIRPAGRMRPAKAFQSRSTNEVCLPSVFRVLCVIESTLNKSFPSIVT